MDKQRVKFITEIAGCDEDERKITFIASTPNTDRQGDIIRVEGWKFDMPITSIPFQWAHDYSQPPIGVLTRAWVENDKLYCDVKFIEKEIYPFADMIYRMYKAGYMNAVSVGFNPDDYEIMKDADGSMTGIDFKSQVLLELSAVPVPANPEALMCAGLTVDDKKILKAMSIEFFEDVLQVERVKEAINIMGIKEVEEITSLCNMRLKDYDESVKKEEIAEAQAVIKGITDRFKKGGTV